MSARYAPARVQANRKWRRQKNQGAKPEGHAPQSIVIIKGAKNANPFLLSGTPCNFAMLSTTGDERGNTEVRSCLERLLCRHPGLTLRAIKTVEMCHE